jgi:Holliday junction resolvase RusA-like endonuclease
MLYPIIIIKGTPATYQKAVMSWRAKDGRSGTHAYDKPTYATWRAFAHGEALRQWGDRPILDGPIVLVAHLFRPVPKSFSKRKQVAALTGVLRPTVKPDCSNQLKALEDACLTGVVIRDDALIVSVTIEKWYSASPRVEIKIEEWSSNGPNSQSVGGSGHHAENSPGVGEALL